MHNLVIALNGVIGAEESCPPQLSHHITAQDLLQHKFRAVVVFPASFLFVFQSAQCFIVLHECPSIPLVVHVVGGVHEADGSNFVWKKHFLLLGMKQSAIGFQASGANPLLKWEFPQNQIQLSTHCFV